MNFEELRGRIFEKLHPLVGSNEAKAIAKRYIDDYLILNRMGRVHDLIDNNKFEKDLLKLSLNYPIQYVTGIEVFMDHVFEVNESVLIPRPETEELVRMIIAETGVSPSKILDLCTGSGCIAISLSLFFKDAFVLATDISSRALETANKNAKILGAKVDFRLEDLLNSNVRSITSPIDIIVSNPPYIPFSESALMDSAVKDYEPKNALFVDDKDPLIFYRSIARLAKSHLGFKGRCYTEVNKSFANNVKDIFYEFGFKNVVVTRDMSGNERFVKAIQE